MRTLPFDGADAAHDAVGAGGDLLGRFAAGAAVAKQLPIGILLMDFGGAEAFVLAVVPFDEIGIDDGDRFEAADFASICGADEGAGENFDEFERLEGRAEFAGVLLATLGEVQVGEAGVLAGEAPGGLGVPGEIDDWKRLAHFLVPSPSSSRRGLLGRR